MLRRVLNLAQGRAPALVADGVLQLLGAAADLALLGLSARLVDRVLKAPSAALGLALVAGLLAIAREAAAYLAARLAARAETGLLADTQARLYAHLQALSIDFFDRSPPGDLAARLFHDVEGVGRLVTGTLTTAVGTGVRLLGVLAVLLRLDWGFGLVTALVALPAVALARLDARRLARRFDRLYADLGDLHDRAQESFGAAELVRSFGRERAESDDFAAAARQLADREAELRLLQARQAPLGAGLRYLALLAGLIYGTRRIAAGALTAGGLTALLVGAWAFLEALQSLLGSASTAQAGLASARRVFAILDQEPSVAAPPAGRRAAFEGDLCLENVGFAYPGRPPALRDIQLSIRPGERIALIGPSGSGKTTLLRLLLRLIDPSDGRLTLDGVDLRELELSSLRGLFATVPQHSLLLGRTLAENIAFGHAAAGPAAIAAAAESAGLEPVLARLPQGLETRLGPEGKGLSAGERQRVGLARALVRPAPFLILDEATSALDLAAEAELLETLARSAQGRTLLLVSHRPTIAQRVDRVVALAEGRLVSDGRALG